MIFNMIQLETNAENETNDDKQRRIRKYVRNFLRYVKHWKGSLSNNKIKLIAKTSLRKAQRIIETRQLADDKVWKMAKKTASWNSDWWIWLEKQKMNDSKKVLLLTNFGDASQQQPHCYRVRLFHFFPVIRENPKLTKINFLIKICQKNMA